MIERDDDAPYGRIAQDRSPRREPAPSAREADAAIRAHPSTTPEQFLFLDRVAARRTLLDHLERLHGRTFRSSYVSVEELQQVHRVLDELDAER